MNSSNNNTSEGKIPNTSEVNKEYATTLADLVDLPANLIGFDYDVLEAEEDYRKATDVDIVDRRVDRRFETPRRPNRRPVLSGGSPSRFDVDFTWPDFEAERIVNNEGEERKQSEPIFEPVVIETSVKEESGPYTCDVVFSFDTTSSMSTVIKSVRENLTKTIDRLFQEIPGLRIGLIAHGDYCDYPQMMWKINLTRDIQELKNFVTKSKNTSGGDFPECYEYSLKVANEMNWASDCRVLVVIGDATPHEKGYDLSRFRIGELGNELQIDWKEEMQKCAEKKI